MSISLAEILPILDQEYKVIGDPGISINRVSTPTDADNQSLVWFSNGANISQIDAAIYFLPMPVLDAPIPPGKAVVFLQDPRLAAITVLNRFFKQRPDWGIHPTATIHPEASIDPQTHIGPNTYIGKCTIGQGSILYGNNYLYNGVKIGADATIHAGVIIGTDGFGYQHGPSNEWMKFEHLGGVEIGNSVEIGANTCIDRGTLGNTKIGDGTKIDNLVHIAHNVEIGKHCLIIAHAMIGGSCIIGDHSWIAPNASLLQKIRVGANATIGLGAVVLEDVPAGETWAGVPAHKIHRQNNNPHESA